MKRRQSTGADGEKAETSGSRHEDFKATGIRMLQHAMTNTTETNIFSLKAQHRNKVSTKKKNIFLSGNLRTKKFKN